MSIIPKVFISYSHDSENHKSWVLKLAEDLVQNGIDVILDQWDLGIGAEITHFMEQGISSTDKIIIVCTDEYCFKANKGHGGVGYERMIITNEIVKKIDTQKFIPIVRQRKKEKSIPKFLGSRLYIDFSANNDYKNSLELLLREIHGVPKVKKPKIGVNPFLHLNSVKIITDIGNEKTLETTPNNFKRAIEIWETIKDTIIEKLGVERDEIYLDAKIANLVGIDDVDTVELHMVLADSFHIAIPGEEVEKWIYLRDAFHCLQNLLKK